jgi:hypothetical protein
VRQGTRRRSLGCWCGCPRSRVSPPPVSPTIGAFPPLRTGRAPFTHPAPRQPSLRQSPD